MIVKICVPRNSGIRKIIVDYYYNLYTQHRLRNPHSSYTLKQMKEYVKHAYSYLRLPLNTDNLKTSDYEKWKNEGWLQYSAWNWYYYAFALKKKGKDEIVAVIKDVHHRNDHHNDTMETKPYESKKTRRILESKINRIVREVINEMLYNGKWLLN